jgi:hypothetical protein
LSAPRPPVAKRDRRTNRHSTIPLSSRYAATRRLRRSAL